MSHEGTAWQVRYSLTYLDQLDDRRYRARRRDIERRLAKLLEDPYLAAGAERLKYDYVGLRSARAFDATRIIYRICGECRRLEEQGRLPLDCCLTGDTPEHMVNILCLSEHYSDMPLEFEFDE